MGTVIKIQTFLLGLLITHVTKRVLKCNFRADIKQTICGYQYVHVHALGEKNLVCCAYDILRYCIYSI